jgi:hypothetical protein
LKNNNSCYFHWKGKTRKPPVTTWPSTLLDVQMRETRERSTLSRSSDHDHALGIDKSQITPLRMWSWGCGK